MSDDTAEQGALNSDASPDQQEEAEPKKPSAQILRHEMQEALNAFDRSSSQLFLSGISAGLEIGFSLFLMAVMQTLVQDQLPSSVVALLVANMYAFGFILVVIGRSELFTEQTSLAVLPVLSRQVPVRALARLWSIVYVANLIGAAASAAIMVLVGPQLGVINRKVIVELAEHVVDHPAHVIVLSGILAGWLMGLLSWLVAAGRDTISQIVIVWMITTAIGLGHLHHCIVGSVEVLAGLFSSSTLSPQDFARFLLWATLGNAIGGPFFLALLKYTQARPEHPSA